MATENTQPRQPKSIFEQLAFGLQTVNENIVDLYKLVGEIHTALFANISEPNANGTEETKEE